MGRQAVIQIDCARCGCKEYLDAPAEGTKSVDVDLVVTFLGETHQFDDLCSKCKATCKNYVDNLFKDVKGNKANKKKRSPNRRSSSPETLSTPSLDAGSSSVRGRPTS